MKHKINAMVSIIMALWMAPATVHSYPTYSYSEKETALVHTFTFAAGDTADSRAVESCASMSYSATIASGDVIEIRQLDSSSAAASTGTLVTIATSTTSTQTLSVGKPWIKLVSTTATTGGSTVRIYCSNLSLGGGGGTGGLVLQEAYAQCVKVWPTGATANRCDELQIVSSQSALESCGAGAGDPICYLDQTITVDAALNAGSGGSFDRGVVITRGDGESPTIICKPGTEIHVLGVDGSSQGLTMFQIEKDQFDDTDAGTISMVIGCTVIEYDPATNKPGTAYDTSGPGAEGIVFKSASQTAVQNAYDVAYAQTFYAIGNTVQQFNPGSAGYGIGVNPDTATRAFYLNNTVHAGLGFDAKIMCNGCETLWVTAIENTVFCDNAVNTDSGTPAIFKIDNDSNLWAERNRAVGCAILWDATNTNVTYSPDTTAGEAHFYDNQFSDFYPGGASDRNANFIAVASNAGTPRFYGKRNTLRNINPENEFMQVIGAVGGEIEFTYLDCFDTTIFTQWLDIQSVNQAISGNSVGNVMGDFSLTVNMPDGCSVPSGGTGSNEFIAATTDAGVDEAGTKLFVKVGPAAVFEDGGAPVTTSDNNIFEYYTTTLPHVNTKGNRTFGEPIFLSVCADLYSEDATPQTSGTPDDYCDSDRTPQFSTGFEVAANVGAYCMNVYDSSNTLITDSGTDGTCDEELTGINTVVVNWRPR